MRKEGGREERGNKKKMEEGGKGRCLDREERDKVGRRGGGNR
jgi:hypothetical protein